MKTPLFGGARLLAFAALASFAAHHSPAAVLVNLDASALPAGNLASWPNAGSVAGAFNSSGTAQPVVGTTGFVNAVTFNGGTTFMTGPAAPAGVTGTTKARSVEAWVYNPTINPEETIIAWGRRGANGQNMSFGFGSDPAFGAVGQFGAAFDLSWGSSVPSAAQWHHLVYTYDGGIGRLYVDGAQVNSKIVGQTNVFALDGQASPQPLNFVLAGQGNNATPFLPFAAGQSFAATLSLAKVRVHDTVLTSGQIASTFASEFPAFDLPAINSFTASSATYLPGQPVTLTWRTANATAVSIDNGVGTVGASGSVVVYPPGGSVTYTLTATKGAQTVTSAVTVGHPVFTFGARPPLAHRWSFNESNSAGAADTALIDSVGASHGTTSGQQNGIIRGPYNATVGTGTAWTRVTAAGTAAGTAGVRLGGGTWPTSAYIDLPNGIFDGMTTGVSVEGWMIVHGSQNWARMFDFGIGTTVANAAASVLEINDIGQPAGSTVYNGWDYWTMSAQRGTNQTQHRHSMRFNNVEMGTAETDFDDPTTNGTQFHFVSTYNPTGNNATPQIRYYKNGVLLKSGNTTHNLLSLNLKNMWLGRSQFRGDNNTNGTYNEFRVWNGIMPLDQITGNRDAGPDSVPVAPDVVLQSFQTSKSIIYKGDSVNLSWQITDPQARGVTVSINNGATVPSPTNLLSYGTASPALTTNYTLTASYLVSGTPTTKTASVTVTVLNGLPVALPSGACTPAGVAVSVPLIAQDPDSTVFTYTIATAPLLGTLTGTGASRTYTPDAGFSGTDTFTYSVNDGLTESAVATATITVLPAPVALTNIAVDDNELRTNSGIGSFAGRLQPTGGNPAGSVTWSLVSGTGDTNNAWFTITNGQLVSTHDFSADLGTVVSIRLRGEDGMGNMVEKVVTSTVKAPDLHVKINEINYNGTRNTQRVEFIELYNPLPTAVSLAGWAFTKGVNFTFPTGASIAPGGYVVIAEDPVTLGALYNIPGSVPLLGPWTGGLSSDGDDITLRDAGGTKVDGVQFGVTAPWPAAPNGTGATLELINPAADNDLGGHWRASTVTQAPLSLVPASDPSWKYLKGTAAAPAGWQDPAFADGSWTTGQTPIGLFKINSNTATSYHPESGVLLNTQLTDMATYAAAPTVAVPNSFPLVAGNYRTVYFRKNFNVADTALVPRALLLRVMHNDAAVVWLNGVEVARFGFPDGAAAQPDVNTTAIYERANYPWSELVIANPASIMVNGQNTLSIQGIAKDPMPRLVSGQEDLASYNIFDFCIDASLGSIPENTGTPGLQNSTFAANVPPAVRNIDHAPVAPKSFEPIVVSAKVTDSDGIGSVQLAYQVCTAGNYIPAKQSLLPSAVTATRIDWALINTDAQMPDNPAFEDPANWTVIPMTDNGTVKGDVAGDGTYSAVIPAQPHRALVRYRIIASDLQSATVRVPDASDPRKNFAAYVYDAVPAYFGVNGESISTTTLNSLPVYQMLMKGTDFDRLIAYNTTDQFVNSIELTALRARKFFDQTGTMVYDGKVYDHTEVRLRGGNSRYGSFAPAPPASVGKRHLRFRFVDGVPFEAKDEKGRPYPRPWREMLFNKMFGNKGNYDYGIPYEVGARMWRLQGLPMPESHWVHFRVVRNAGEVQDPVNGDFYGMYQALEFPDGKDFLKGRNLAQGNFYKMSDWTQNGELDARYQARGWYDAANTFHPAVDFAEDFDNIRYNAHQTAANAWLNRYVDMNLFYGYKVIQEAIRHYDIFIEPTGRHRMKNLIWYFRPTPDDLTNKYGQLVHMPYDWDASFGPSFNNGTDLIHNAVFDGQQGYTGVDITDSPSWLLPKNSALNDTDRTAIRVAYRNRLREFRDLFMYRDGTGTGPFDQTVDDALATISTFWPADKARWPVTGAQLENVNGAVFKAQDMKNFCFTGWSDSLTSGPAVGAGGRAAYLDTITDTTQSAVVAGGPQEATLIPVKPTLTYSGVAGFPLDGLAFTTSVFNDPQGSGAARTLEWRLAEIAAPTATTDRLYEMTAIWSKSLATWDGTAVSQQLPASALATGHTYRVRVRHLDETGRASHWSDPVEFVAAAANTEALLAADLVVTELMYKPAAPTATEISSGWTEGDFEYIEFQNISPTLTLSLADVKIALGVEFDFTAATITSLAPGARVLVVKNVAAFTARYGSGKPVAGTWKSTQNFSNGGEQVKITYGQSGVVRDFIYDDLAPWPAGADSGGRSLVLIDPASNPNHALPASWRASYVVGGSPGGKDTQSLAEWLTAHSEVSPSADPDGDGLDNCLTYALGHDLRPFAITPAIETAAGQTHLVFDYTRRIGTEQTVFVPRVSTDLDSWDSTPSALQVVSVVDNGDGTETVHVKDTAPFDTTQRHFLSILVQHP